jgi:hypothetical protein
VAGKEIAEAFGGGCEGEELETRTPLPYICVHVRSINEYMMQKSSVYIREWLLFPSMDREGQYMQG